MNVCGVVYVVCRPHSQQEEKQQRNTREVSLRKIDKQHAETERYVACWWVGSHLPQVPLIDLHPPSVCQSQNELFVVLLTLVPALLLQEKEERIEEGERVMEKKASVSLNSRKMVRRGVQNGTK